MIYLEGGADEEAFLFRQYCLFLACRVIVDVSITEELWPAKTGGAAYVGSETCKSCHENAYNTYARSIHGKKTIRGGPGATSGCEACHGPGGIHIEKGGGKEGIISFGKKTGAGQKSAMCMSCHENSKELTNWDLGRHKTVGVSCDARRAVHSTSRGNLKASQPGLYVSCHKDIRGQMNKQARHPIQEGKVKCTDCHTAHGGFGKKGILADSTPELCYKCHTEKRGPFVYQHAPVVEDCGICHTPHGSNHNNLLVRQVPQICQSCHDWAAIQQIYIRISTASSGVLPQARTGFARAFLSCHGNVHASNRSAAFER